MDLILAHLNFHVPGQAGWMGCFMLFWALLIGHALADFPLQGDFLAVGKDRHADLSAATGGRVWPNGFWLVCLTVHSLVHSGVVWLITGSFWLSLVEFVLHWIIDFAKCERWTSFYVDQGLHLLCKVAYLVPLCMGWLG